MILRTLRIITGWGWGLLAVSATWAAPPRCLDSGLVLERIAGAPDLVTPIGCAVDPSGRIAVLESHTHFPPEGYPGPKSDRILIFPSPSDGSPRVLISEGLRWGMNLAFGPDRALYLTHRNGVLRFEIPGGAADTPAPARREIVTLETRGDYPHNGVGGLAFGPDGWLYLGTGENLGLAYTIRGSDGRRVSLNAGAGGVVVRCRPDGSNLEPVATGFWNAFGLAFDAHGRLFLVDNDPNSRPPCRLIHVIPGGNYGFQFRHGRDGLSPLIAWDGELPGTLGMVAGTGEAPSSVLDAARTRLPAAYDGTLLVAATWDHRIERYRPAPVGATFRASAEVLVEGDENFRPVCLAAAPDGSVIFTDWVKSDYPVHQAGALWRLASRTPAVHAPQSLPPPSALEQEREALSRERDEARLLRAAGHSDPFMRSAAADRMSGWTPETLEKSWQTASGRQRDTLMLAARRALVTAGGDSTAAAGEWIRRGLLDESSEVRMAALVWALEDSLCTAEAASPGVLNGTAVTPRLAALQALAVKQAGATPPTPVKTPSADNTSVQTLSMRTSFSEEQTRQATARVLDAKAPEFLRTEAARDLAATTDSAAVAALQTLARDRSAPEALRCEAILALTGSHHDQVSGLRSLLEDPSEDVATEVARALRPWIETDGVRTALETAAASGHPRRAAVAGLVLSRPAERPASFDEWRQFLEAEPGDAARGSRTFRSPEVGCIRCHQVFGRGGTLGPDLSAIRRGSDRQKLLRSLLEPSRDIAPQFADHQVETPEGEYYSGRLVSTEPDGSITVMNGDGQQTRIPGSRVKSNAPGTVSLMPEGLMDALTPGEVRDLMTYLETLR